jgi:hypothetical protein
MNRKITLTIPVEVRTPRSKEVKVKVWLGTKWKHLNWTPFSPELAARTGTKPFSYKTVLEFLPPGVVPMDQLKYQQGLLVTMRKLGVLK